MSEAEIVDQRMVIAEAIVEFWNNTDALVDVRIIKNTSGCPIVEVEYGDGEKFNLTITRARKKP